MCTWPVTLADIDAGAGLVHAFVESRGLRFYVGSADSFCDAEAIARQYISPTRVVGITDKAGSMRIDGAWQELARAEAH